MRTISIAGATTVLLSLSLLPSAAGAQIAGCANGGCSNARATVKGYSKQIGENSANYTYWKREDSDRGTLSAGASLNQSSPKDVHIEGSAIADLSSGALHASIAQTGGGGGSATAGMTDTVAFELPAGISSAQASVTWVLEGVNDFVTGRSVAYVSAAGLSMTKQSGIGNGFNIDLSFLRQQSAESGWLFYTKGFNRVEVTRNFRIFSGDVYMLNSYVNLNTYADDKVCSPLHGCVAYLDPSKADYGNTSFFNFTLPSGVKMLSGSGTLLSNPYAPGGGSVGAVPEPATWAMMLAGFAMLGTAMRRRRLHRDVCFQTHRQLI